ncbi:tetratricopeptide repeat-containing sensor histidine kinase [Maribacter sp. CXY002]|uniref:tetratricopeptide repeat-containing sensor histidine kinase n=1 Tax=Maribacter luteocoastalis TaxID=3407671 RepID=UPI003B681719
MNRRILLIRKKFLNFPVLLCVFVFLQINQANAQVSLRDSILHELGNLKLQGIKKSDTLYIDTMLDLADEQRYFVLDSLYILAKEALSLSQQSGYLKGESNAFTSLGTYYSDKGKYDTAIKNYKNASKIADEIGNSTLKLSNINNIAGEYGYMGDYALALKYYLQGIELAENVNAKIMLSIITENIANLYISQKDYTQAMIFYTKVKSLNEEIGDPIIMAETMSNMASAYADMNNLELAMYNVNNSIRIFEDKKILDWLAYAYEIKGKIYLKQEKYNWAMYWYRQSELLHNDLNDDRSEIPLLNGIAKANLKLNKDSISEVYAKKAMGLSKKIADISGTRECAEILYAINKKKGDFKEALTYHELYQKVSDTLSRNENKKGLTMLKTKIEYDQQKELLILENEEALAKQWLYLNIALFLLLIFLGITLLIRKNARIQKALNKELISKQSDLEKKEEHLKELNETKNKLFSIIGHDLRGPIGAFQGLIKLFKEGEMTKDEFLGFVPKLKSDIDHISFTLNNLLSWGQTQMNGSVTKPRSTDLKHIVLENIALLTEIANSKSIKLINRLDDNTLTWSDSDQMDIVIRNLISNALKFTPKNGMVTIGAIEKTKHWEIYVRDNGIGMNEETMGKIFSKSQTHTSYGTNDEKGTGLGLSLCKEMIEKNNGIIWVNSALNKGSSFYFTLPKAVKKYKKTA